MDLWQSISFCSSLIRPIHPYVKSYVFLVSVFSFRCICMCFYSYGPREVKFRDEFSLLGQINCELKFATFSGKLRRQHQQDSQEKEASLIVKEALEPAVLLVSFFSY